MQKIKYGIYYNKFCKHFDYKERLMINNMSCLSQKNCMFIIILKLRSYSLNILYTQNDKDTQKKKTWPRYKCMLMSDIFCH